MTTETTNVSGNDQILPEKISPRRKLKQHQKPSPTEKLEANTIEKLLKDCKTGDLIQIKYPAGVQGDFTFYYVEHHHGSGTEVYKRNDAAKRIPFTFSSNVSVVVYLKGYISNDNILPYHKFKRVPLASVPAGGLFCFGKGKSLMLVEANHNSYVSYCYANGACYEPFTSSGAVRVFHLIERKEAENV